MRKLANLVAACMAIVACSGCTLFLPHKPCLLYSGDLRNAHGFGEVGRGGNLYRSDGVAYVFNPWLIIRQSNDTEMTLEVSDQVQAYFTDAGVTLILQCRKPDNQLSTRSTADGSLRAWMVRDQEYPRRAIKPALGDFSHPWVPADYSPLWAAPASTTQPPLPGVYRLTGTIEIRARSGLPQHAGIDVLAFHLTTFEPVSVDEAWLSRNEQVTAESLKEFPNAQGILEDAAACTALRKTGHFSPTAARIEGSFRLTQCLDYGHMP